MESLELTNRVAPLRIARGWSQAELAQAAGISRTAVSAIEGRRLAPSVAAALALAQALGCSVEELFSIGGQPLAAPAWAWPPPQVDWRYWQAEVGGRMLLYPVESLSAASLPHDGVATRRDAPAPVEWLAADASIAAQARRTLVVACCDPAAGLLAALYGRMTDFRMLTIPRSSQQGLELLAAGRVHVAGLHLASAEDEARNLQAARARLGSGFELLRAATWQEGLAVAPQVAARTIRGIVGARLRWIGREPGSGARQCLDELLPRRTSFRRLAENHRGVADAIRAGWADVGVCLRLTCEEAGLRFFSLREDYFDFCFPATQQFEPRIQALLRVVRSPEYRRLISDLPGYAPTQAGEILGAT